MSPTSGTHDGFREIDLKATQSRGSECIPVERDFLGPCARGYYRHDIEPVGVAAQIVSGDELIGRRLQPLALLPVHEFPGLPKCLGCPGLDLHEDQRISLEGDNVELAPAGAISTSENVETEVEEMPAGDSFAEPTGQYVRCRHTSNVSAEARLFRPRFRANAFPAGAVERIFELDAF